VKGIWWRLRRSLFARLLLIFVVAALFASLATVAGLRLLYHDELSRGLESYAHHYLAYLVADLGTPPNPQRAAELAQELPLDIRLLGPGLAWASHPAFPTLAELGEPYHHNGEIDLYRVSRHHVLGIRRGPYTILLALPGFSQGEHPQASLLVVVVMLITLLATYGAVRWLFRPLTWISEGAARIGRGDLAHRLPEQRTDDLGGLVRDINAMAAALEQLLEAKRQLLLAVSHELRTPLTRAKLGLEFLPPDGAARHVVQEELDEMEQLLDELLETERLHGDHQRLQLREVELVDLIERLIEERFAGERQRLELILPTQAVVTCADAARLRLLLRNLLGNALHHSAPSARVVLRLTLHPATYLIEVSDHGPGIAPQHLPYLTEPFYRADASRQRETGGFGLGLYLCRLVVEAHAGELVLSSRPGQGTTVRAQLPLRPECP